MNELFNTKECKSPKLKWRERHNIIVHYTEWDEDGWLPWMAWDKTNNDKEDNMPINPDVCGYGKTEDEALSALATMIGHWNVN